MEMQRKEGLNVKQKRVLKLALDAVMLVLLVLMYKKQVVSLAFHEIGGLALFGLVLVHLLVNARWIGSATMRLFAKGTPGLVRARYIVDALLLISFLAVGVTGILISKVVFNVHVAGNAQTLHDFTAALSVLFMGVHLGLHADYIFGKLLRKGANKAAKIVFAIVLAAMIAFGGYSLFSSSFVSFLASPLQAARFSHGTFEPSGEPALDGSAGERPADLSELPEFSGDDSTQPPQSGTGSVQPSEGNHEGGGFGGRGQGGGNGQGQGGGFGGEGRGRGDSTGALLLIAQYVSMIALFGAATYGVLKLVGRRRRPQAVVVDTVPEIAETSEASESAEPPQK